MLSNLSLRSSSTAAQCVLQPQPKAVDENDDDAAQPAIFSVLPEIPFHLSFIFHFKAIGPLVTVEAYLISGAIGTATVAEALFIKAAAAAFQPLLSPPIRAGICGLH